MRRKGFIIGGTAAASLAASLPAAAQGLGQHFGQQITIAVNLPLSGRLIRAGERVTDGVRAAIQEADQLAGPLQRVFALRTFDDSGALASAITNVQFAADDPTIVATIGNLQGSVTDATLPQYAQAQMPLIVPTATADAITSHGYRNVWRLPTKDSVEGAYFAKFLAAHKPKLALAVTQDGDYGYDVAQGFVRQAGLEKYPADAYVFPIDKPDFTLAAKTMMQKSPDYVYLCGRVEDMGPIVPALRAAGFTGAFGGSDGFFNAQTIRTYGTLIGSATFSSSFPPLERAPSAFQLLTDFRARYGEITALSAFGYAAAQIAISLVQRTGAADRLSFLSAMEQGGTFNTIVGDFTFSPTGDPIDPNVYFYTIEGQTFTYLKAARPTGFIL